MAFRIQNNVAALSSLNYLNKNALGMNKSLERLSSGYRINSGADDAAGLASSMRMRGEISSLKVASRNASEASSLLQVAEGGMSQIDLILNRMKELATQAASSNAGSDLSKINAEATQLKNEIGRIVSFTKYNGTALLDGNFGAVSLSSTAPVQFTAANGVENIDVSNAKAATTYSTTAISQTANTITLSDGTTSQTLTYSTTLSVNQDQVLDFTSLGVKLTVNSLFATNEASLSTAGRIYTSTLSNATFQIGNENASSSQLGFTLVALDLTHLKGGATLTADLSTQANAQTALADIDTAISYLASQRGTVGAYINRFSYASSNLETSIQNKTASESTIRDVDMAAEMSEFTKNQILVNASTAMLAQANTAPQSVLSLLK